MERASESKDLYALVEEAHGFHDKIVGWSCRTEGLAEELFWSVAVNEFVGHFTTAVVRDMCMNRRWTTREVSAVRTGLRAMGATAHLDWFEWLAAQVAALAGDIPRFPRKCRVRRQGCPRRAVPQGPGLLRAGPAQIHPSHPQPLATVASKSQSARQR